MTKEITRKNRNLRRCAVILTFRKFSEFYVEIFQIFLQCTFMKYFAEKKFKDILKYNTANKKSLSMPQ
jgi:hypothetical protein